MQIIGLASDRTRRREASVAFSFSEHPNMLGTSVSPDKLDPTLLRAFNHWLGKADEDLKNNPLASRTMLMTGIELCFGSVAQVPTPLDIAYRDTSKSRDIDLGIGWNVPVGYKLVPLTEVEFRVDWEGWWIEAPVLSVGDYTLPSPEFRFQSNRYAMKLERDSTDTVGGAIRTIGKQIEDYTHELYVFICLSVDLRDWVRRMRKGRLTEEEMMWNKQEATRQ